MVGQGVRQPKPMGDVVVVLPGILGSVLGDDRGDVWAPTASALGRALRSQLHSLRELAITRPDGTVAGPAPGLRATRLMPDAHLVPGLWKIDGYSGLVGALAGRFDLRHGHNFFDFPYDWRLDNTLAAEALSTASQGWLSRWREESGNSDARLILVAHSMGGLVSRYFLEVLGGWKVTRYLITFGTPYSGSLNALDFIVNGYRTKLWKVRLPEIELLSTLLRSFPSVYQLLPTYRCLLSGGEITTLADAPAAIAKLDPRLYGEAVAFHARIAQAAAGNAEDDGYRRDGYRLVPFVGTMQPTLQAAEVTGDGMRMLDRHPEHDLAGDGTVPQVSATPEGWDDMPAVRAMVERHAELQNARSGHANLFLTLEGRPQFRMRGRANVIAIDVDDAYLPDESPIALRYRVDQAPVDPPLPGGGEYAGQLEVEVFDADTGTPAAPVVVVKGRPDWQTLELPPLSPGAYRLRVRGATGDVDPVSDLFAVLGEEDGESSDATMTATGGRDASA